MSDLTDRLRKFSGPYTQEVRTTTRDAADLIEAIEARIEKWLAIEPDDGQLSKKALWDIHRLLYPENKENDNG